MAYIKSKDIQLFPSAFRGQYDTPENDVFNPASRLTTEYNLTTLSARASRFHQSYVLDYKSETVDKTIIFNIKGYLFSVKMATFLATLTPETQQIWAKIKLENIAPDDINNTVDTNPVLRPVEESGTLLDRRLTAEGDFLFLGLSLETVEPTSALLGEPTLLILEKTGGEWDVPAKSYFRMSANEISDVTTTNKSINEKFNTEDLTVTKINKITITPPSNTSTLTIKDGKTLTVNGSVTLAGTGTATFNQNLTVAGPHNITLETDNANRTLKVSGNNKELAGAGGKLTLTGSPSLSGITTTGSGTLALNKNLTVDGENKTFAGAGTSLTIDNNLDIAGTTAQITLGTNPYTLKFTTTGETTLELPTTGTLATTAEIATAIDDTLNNITLTGNNATITLTVADKTPKEITINNVSNAGKATYAAHLSGGTSGKYPQLLYQSDNNVTNKFDKGLANEILRMNSTGDGFTWTSPGNLSVKSASNIAGGISQAIPYQTGVGTTNFIMGPEYAYYQVLTNTERGFEWVRGVDFMDESLDLENVGFIKRTGTSKKYTTKVIFATETSYSIKKVYDWFREPETVRIFSGGYQILRVYTYSESSKDYYAISYLSGSEIINESTEDRTNSLRNWTRVYFDV